MSLERYRRFIRQAEESLDYWLAGAELELTEEVVRVMGEQGVTRAELARRLGTSSAHVTQLLRGDVNFTLRTIVKLSRALDRDLRIHLAPQGAHTVWKDEIASPPADWYTERSKPPEGWGAAVKEVEDATFPLVA